MNDKGSCGTYIEWSISHKKNENESVVMMWMNLETVTQRRVSQKEKKQILCINAYIYRIY